MPRISEAAYRMILARRAGDARVDVPPRTPRRGSEAALHQEILDYARSRSWIALHGSMAHQTHRTVGEPDFVILADRGRVLLIEVKRPGGKLSGEQAALQAWAKRLGHTVSVVRNLQEFAELLAEGSDQEAAGRNAPTASDACSGDASCPSDSS